jgi:hypothetical protein
VFRFIKEYSSLSDFGLYVIGLFLYKDVWKMVFWLVLKVEIKCGVIISWQFWFLLEDFLKIILLQGDIFEFS